MNNPKGYTPYNQFNNPANNYYLGSGDSYPFDYDPSLSFVRQGTNRVKPISIRSNGYLYPMIPLQTALAFQVLGKAPPSGPWINHGPFNPEFLFPTIMPPDDL